MLSPACRYTEHHRQERTTHHGNHRPPFYMFDVCLTQALIDKYGVPLPHISGDCHITRLDKKANSMSAEMVCSGAIIGKATMQSSWTADHATGSVHFVGTAPQAPSP
jgi:Protein of unknown function (DUF3617)